MKAGFTGDHGRRYLGLGGHSKYAWTESCGNDAIYCCYPVYSHVGLLQEAVAKARSWTSRAELVIFVGVQGMYGSVYWNYIRPSVKIVQINPGGTQFDSFATLNIREQADVVFA